MIVITNIWPCSPDFRSSYRLGLWGSWFHATMASIYLCMSSGGKFALNSTCNSSCFVFILWASCSCDASFFPVSKMTISNGMRWYIIKSFLTQVHDFSPIPWSSMIVNRLVSCSSSHLFRTHTDWVHVGPPPLGILSIGAHAVWQVVQQIFGLALAVCASTRRAHNLSSELSTWRRVTALYLPVKWTVQEFGVSYSGDETTGGESCTSVLGEEWLRCGLHEDCYLYRGGYNDITCSNTIRQCQNREKSLSGVFGGLSISLIWSSDLRLIPTPSLAALIVNHPIGYYHDHKEKLKALWMLERFREAVNGQAWDLGPLAQRGNTSRTH